ncbi:MAG: polysaccharide biosynthesis protein [Clostridiales bacterium]|nr:polysaccharide biosynthesis protein [Clostridiales bacterium]
MKINLRKLILILADIVMMFSIGIIVAWILPVTANYLGGNYIMGYRKIFVAILFQSFFSFIFLWIFGAYSILWRNARIKDYVSCVLGIISGSAVTIMVFEIMENYATLVNVFSVPKGYFILCAAVQLFTICAFRFVFRKAFLSINRHERELYKKRVMIIGAGNACKMILREIQNAQTDPNNSSRNYLPVCIVDDDPAKLHKHIENVPVLGTTKQIAELSQKHDIELIIFAIPSCDEKNRKRIIDSCADTKCDIKIVPYLSNVFFEDSNNHIMNQIKDIRIEDLLGRDPVTFDKKEISELINGKVCMVTGAGGSIGSELVRQIIKYKPRLVVLVDIYENSLYEIQQELFMEYGRDVNIVSLISSVRDFDKMSLIFEKYKPQIVFHAAAHKHVPLMEDSPEEAVKNNIFGTFNVMKLAETYGVNKFIMISTDKAVNPTNVMGATKRCCEMIAQYMAQSNGKTEFIATRFGNVLGSNGSVIPLFKRQIESGKPLTVTHPDIIRYFMTIPEAVALVMQAAAIAKGGEIFVLDMGSPVKILSLAENLIKMYGKVPYKDVQIIFTGLRPGEKLYEELLMDEEGLKSTANKKIFVGNQIHIDREQFIKQLEELKKYADENDSEKTVKMLETIVPTFNHKTNN